ncbi:12557_t:CDS:2 [Funneliformis geosporum]|nr:12557_t:CDS:2 [Funneliformis geosporum]
MSKQLKTIEIKANQKREGKAFGCSEIFTLDNKEFRKDNDLPFGTFNPEPVIRFGGFALEEPY